MPYMKHRAVGKGGRVVMWIAFILFVVFMVASWFFVQWRADACHHRGGVFTGNGQCVAPGVLR